MAVTSFVLGILGLSGWIAFLGVFSGTLTAVPALVLSILSLKKGKGKTGLVIAALILSIVGIIGVIINAIVNRRGFGYMF